MSGPSDGGPICAALVLMVVLTGCSRPQPSQARAQPKKVEKAVTGWGPLKLGMGYDEALAALPEARWNPSAVKDCQDDMAVHGCFLSQYEGVTFTIDGIGFSPQLSFNKRGRLTDISLNYEHDGRITREECMDLYARTLDRLVGEFGKFAFPQRAADAAGWRTEYRRTPRGVPFAIGTKSGSQDFIASPMRGQIEGVRLPTPVPIVKWNDRPYVSVGAFMLAMRRHTVCNLTVDYSDSPSIERRRTQFQ